MILKTLSRKSGVKQLVNYLFKDQTKLSNEKFEPLVIRHNIRCRKIDTITKEIEKNNALRTVKRKNNIQAYHSILSFGVGDKAKIDNSILKNIAKQYIKLNGKDKQYVITSHIEKDHIHLHAVIGGTKYHTGEASRITKKEFANLKTKLQDYQKEKYPELEHSVVEHGKNAKDKLYSKDIRSTKLQTLESHLGIAYSTAISQEDFLDQIKQLGHEPYYRNGKLTGLKYEGTGAKFRLSKLGYDATKLETLNKENEEDKELKELSSLSDNASSRTKDVETRSRLLNDNEEEKDTELETDLEQENENDYER
jgi:Relaxase/Mobilisation nuclease domain